MDENRSPVAKVECDEDEHDEYLSPEVVARAVKAALAAQKKPTETRPEFGVTVVEESEAGITKDVTVIHSDWKTGKKGQGVKLLCPGPKRNAVAWQVAHTYLASDGAELFVCNICGKDLKLSGSAGAISSHLKRLHPGVKEQLEEVERNGIPINSPPPPVYQQPQQKKRKNSSLPIAASKKADQVIPLLLDIPLLTEPDV